MRIPPILGVVSLLRPQSGAVTSALTDGDDVRLVEVVAREADVREEEAADVLRVVGMIR